VRIEKKKVGELQKKSKQMIMSIAGQTTGRRDILLTASGADAARTGVRAPAPSFTQIEHTKREDHGDHSRKECTAPLAWLILTKTKQRQDPLG
jgi:hypothetical protein